jgi:hypothetical protein
MFQLAAAYAHSRKLGAPLQVFQKKAIDDGRPLYWETALCRFQPFLTGTLCTAATAATAATAPAAPLWKEPHGATKYVELPPLPVHLDGYFQSSKYFQNLPRAEVAALFAPRLDVVRSVHEKCAAILAHPHIIMVHARRGDYCKNAGMIAFHGPLTPSYYVEALSKLVNEAHSKGQEPLLLFVSEDETFWHTDVFPALPTKVASVPRACAPALDEEETLYLMSQCDAFVISNSTFSWWGAWLAGAGRRVIAPRQWFGPTGLKDYEDVYEAGWERL